MSEKENPSKSENYEDGLEIMLKKIIEITEKPTFNLGMGLTFFALSYHYLAVLDMGEQYRIIFGFGLGVIGARIGLMIESFFKRKNKSITKEQLK